jgi:hypothetical protein
VVRKESMTSMVLLAAADDEADDTIGPPQKRQQMQRRPPLRQPILNPRAFHLLPEFLHLHRLCPSFLFIARSHALILSSDLACDGLNAIKFT